MAHWRSAPNVQRTCIKIDQVSLARTNPNVNSAKKLWSQTKNLQQHTKKSEAENNFAKQYHSRDLQSLYKSMPQRAQVAVDAQDSDS